MSVRWEKGDPGEKTEEAQGDAWLMFWAWVVVMAIYAVSYVISLPFADR